MFQGIFSIQKYHHFLTSVSILFGLLSGLFSSDALSQIADEYQVKSAYIEKISQFITWPQQKNFSQKDTFIIGIAGKNPFGKTIDTYFEKQKIKNKKVIIIKVDDYEDIANCDILFISESEKDKIEDYVYHAEKNNVLLVSDTKGFAEKGIHINLPLKDAKVKLQINYECMKNAHFSIESILLGHAEIIECEKHKGDKNAP